jgi:hypothetical protein
VLHVTPFTFQRMVLLLVRLDESLPFVIGNVINTIQVPTLDFHQVELDGNDLTLDLLQALIMGRVAGLPVISHRRHTGSRRKCGPAGFANAFVNLVGPDRAHWCKGYGEYNRPEDSSLHSCSPFFYWLAMYDLAAGTYTCQQTVGQGQRVNGERPAKVVN